MLYLYKINLKNSKKKKRLEMFVDNKNHGTYSFTNLKKLIRGWTVDT